MGEFLESLRSWEGTGREQSECESESGDASGAIIKYGAGKGFLQTGKSLVYCSLISFPMALLKESFILVEGLRMSRIPLS